MLLLKAAEASCKVRPKESTIRLDSTTLIGVAFEEIIFAKLNGSLKKVVNSGSKFDKKLTDLFMNCFSRFFVLSSNCPHKDLVNQRLAQELRELCNLNHPNSLEAILGLTKSSVLLMVSAVQFFVENFLQIKASWEVFFEICYSLLQLYEFRTNHYVFPANSIPSETLKLLGYLFSPLNIEKIKSCFHLHKLLTQPQDLVHLTRVYFSRVASLRTCHDGGLPSIPA